ncbi:CHAP domain-containing protein [Enterococcus faecalis]|uniref:CHAP domain-containing protein n=1 Tax=Enterococcus faecalis TaxID=1351 RepID=UPI0025B26D40|nr:CHAP domain-containing protein [Enterococcus faecalis]MDN3202061.1 CHAP domain-containing protein [Enterococcus faecalis]
MINRSSKERYHLKRNVCFKGEQKTLRIRSGTIEKFQQKSIYPTISLKKKEEVSKKKIKAKDQLKGETSSFSLLNRKEERKKESTTRFFTFEEKKQERKKKTKEKNPSSSLNKRQKQKKKEKKKQANSSWETVRKNVARTSAKKALIKSVEQLKQEEQEEKKTSSSFQGKVNKGKHFYQASKKAHPFMTKNQKYAKEITQDKLTDLRFSGKNVLKSEKTKRIFSSKKLSNQKTASVVAKNIRRSISKLFMRMIETFLSSNPIGWVITGVTFLLVVLFGVFLLIGAKNEEDSNSGSMYVEHWDGKDAYHSSLLAQRYGIKAEQIDSFIKNEGYTVDERATGKEFLRLQSISGIDVRMLVAFAQMESSYGTAGVAQQFPKANIFGYGAFDNDPNQGASWDNTRAVTEFRSTQIDSYGNSTLAIMDERAKAYHENTLKPGQFVYWTKLNAGKARAAIAEKLDKWIDDHGGTPEPPGGYGPIGSGGAGLAVLDKLLGKIVPGDFGGESGQCYAVSAYYAHSITPEIILRNGIKASEIGNDYSWDKWKWTVIREPKYKDIQAGDIINFHAGANMGSWITDSIYGHTGVVGKVLGNNQFLLYDQNPGPLKTWIVTYVPGSVSSVIHPPKK